MAGKLTNTMGQDGIGSGRQELQSKGPSGPANKAGPNITPSVRGKVPSGHGGVNVGARPNSKGSAGSSAVDPKRGMPRPDGQR